jgi:lysyl-tRNA synthetase class 1
MFAGTRPNTEFTISFDLDVIKIYEDYDRTERIAWKIEPAKNEDVYRKERRIYELSQVSGIPAIAPYQVPFRHLCSLIQIAGGSIDAAIAGLGDLKPEQEAGLRARCVCAKNWIDEYAPEEFCFKLRAAGDTASLNEADKTALQELRDSVIVKIEQFDSDKSCAQAIYDAAARCGVDSKALFRAAYEALIGKDQGPRLASFLRSIGKEKLLAILSTY